MLQLLLFTFYVYCVGCVEFTVSHYFDKECAIECFLLQILFQEMEKERHATKYYEWQTFYPPAIPELKQAARGWKYTYTL